MIDGNLSHEQLKQAIKEALVETMEENRELFTQVISEVLDDFFHARVTRESDRPSAHKRSNVVAAIEGRA